MLVTLFSSYGKPKMSFACVPWGHHDVEGSKLILT